MKTMGIWLVAAAVAAAPSGVVAQPAVSRRQVAAPTERRQRQADEGRKPAEVLDFFGRRKGMRVIDMFGANMYWAEIMAPVVGARGKVTVWQPTQFMNDDRRKNFAAFAKRRKNVALISSSFEAPALGTNAYDFMIMNLDYHDVYWQFERKIAHGAERGSSAYAR